MSARTSRYLRAPTLTAGGATAYLRSAYVLAFMAQGAVAALVGVAVVLLAGAAPRHPSGLLAWILVVLALAQLPVMLFIVTRLGALRTGAGARRAALSIAILTGVLLASTTWFLSLALATGQVGLPLFLLLLMTLTSYSVGFLLMGRLGRLAASEEVGAAEAATGEAAAGEADSAEADPGEAEPAGSGSGEAGSGEAG